MSLATNGVPHREEEVHRFYNWDAQRYDDPEGRLWEAKMIVSVPLPSPIPHVIRGLVSKNVRVHMKLAERSRLLFASLFAAGPEVYSTLAPFAGAYVFRPIRGGESLSMHGFGGAFDFDPAKNPLGSSRYPRACGAALAHGDTRTGEGATHACRFGATAEGQEAITIFARYGFFWGGRFSGRLDCMHFQYATGY